MTKRPRTIEPFESQLVRLTRRAESGCLLWVGIKDTDGYGVAKLGRAVRLRAHRASWELANGRIPQGMCVLHRCDRPSCVEPSHLFLGTPADNNTDCRNKGRHKPGKHYDFGERNPASRVSDRQRDEIAATKGERQLDIARRYGISQAQVSVIQRTWPRREV